MNAFDFDISCVAIVIGDLFSLCFVSSLAGLIAHCQILHYFSFPLSSKLTHILIIFNHILLFLKIPKAFEVDFFETYFCHRKIFNSNFSEL